MAVQHGEQHGQPVALKPHRHPARIAQRADIDQRLHLDQQRPSPLPNHHDQTAGGGILAALQQADLSDRLATIAQPTLILHPDSSPFIPVERAEKLERAS